jgi:hypothetical protein
VVVAYAALSLILQQQKAGLLSESGFKLVWDGESFDLIKTVENYHMMQRARNTGLHAAAGATYGKRTQGQPKNNYLKIVDQIKRWR